MATAETYRRWTWACLFAIFAGSIVGISVPAGLGWDFANFYDTGRRVAVGDFAHLYDEEAPIAGEEPQGNMGFYSVPLSGYFYVPLAWMEPLTASRVLKLQCALALAGGLALFWRELLERRLFPRELASRSAFWFVIAALVYQPFWTIYRVGGQTTPTVFLLIVMALRLLRAERMALATLCWTIVLLIKPAFVFPAALLAVMAGWRFLSWSIAWSTLAAVLSLSLAGWPCHVAFWQTMLEGNRQSVSWVFNSAASVWIENLRLLSDHAPIGPTRPTAIAAGVVISRAIVLSLFVVTWRQMVNVRAMLSCATQRLFQSLTAIVFGVALMPIVWEHYLSVLFLPLLILLHSRLQVARGTRLATQVAFGLAAVQNLILIQIVASSSTFDQVWQLVLIGWAKGGTVAILPILWCLETPAILRALSTPRHNSSSSRAPGDVEDSAEVLQAV